MAARGVRSAEVNAKIARHPDRFGWASAVPSATRLIPTFVPSPNVHNNSRRRSPPLHLPYLSLAAHQVNHPNDDREVIAAGRT